MIGNSEQDDDDEQDIACDRKHLYSLLLLALWVPSVDRNLGRRTIFALVLLCELRGLHNTLIVVGELIHGLWVREVGKRLANGSSGADDVGGRVGRAVRGC